MLPVLPMAMVLVRLASSRATSSLSITVEPTVLHNKTEKSFTNVVGGFKLQKTFGERNSALMKKKDLATSIARHHVSEN